MKIQYKTDLTQQNTFHTPLLAREYCIVENTEDLDTLFSSEYFKKPFTVIGCGSNILFKSSLLENVLKIDIKGLTILEENDYYVVFEVGAGELWEDIVLWSIEQNLIGFHNLGGIPSSTGATPIQNIGAYGSEIKDFLQEVEYFNIHDGKFRTLTNSDCNFGYRDSIFKHELKDIGVITKVIFRLERFKGAIPEKYLQYADIKSEIREDLTPKDLYEIVLSIREKKLPSIEEFGSCGSTFKNAVISKKQYTKILKQYPELPMYEIEGDSENVKIPSAYILEKLGWKNKRIGKCGTWVYHPLIVTNYGGASADDILKVIDMMQRDFLNATGVSLDLEINII